MDFEQKIADYIEKRRLIDKGSRVLAAVSGGVDSVVMLVVLRKLQYRLDFSLEAAHFNHKLRGDEAGRDAVFAENLCKNLGIKFHLGEWDNHPKQGSIQTAARKARFDFFDRVMSENGLDRLALAHHSDDNVETILMAAFKGYGLTGVKGIEPLSGNRIHPMLCVSKSEIIHYARENNIDWSEDSSNSGSKYLRNKVRNQVIPRLQKQFPDLERNLLGLADEVRETLDEIDAVIECKMKEAVIAEGKERIILDIDKIFPYFNMLNNFLFKKIITDLFPNTYISRGGLQQIERLLHSETGSYMETAGLNVFRGRNRLIFIKLTASIDSISAADKGEYIFNQYVIEVKPCGIAGVEFNPAVDIEYADADCIKGGLTIRGWKSGDWFIPFGMTGKVKLSDFFVNAHIERYLKDEIPVLCDEEKIVWVCGYRLDNRVRITPDTVNALKLVIHKIDL